MIKHIIFDLGNVLVHIHPAETMDIFSKKCKIPADQVQQFFLSEVHLNFMEGKYTQHEFFEIMMNTFPCDTTEKEFFDIWRMVIGNAKVGIQEIVQHLKDRFTLSVCSNTDMVHWQHAIEKCAFLQHFKYFFLSFEMKLNKPDPRVFDRILADLSVSASECLFIDDISENIQSARNAGFNTVLAYNAAQIESGLREYGIL